MDEPTTLDYIAPDLRPLAVAVGGLRPAERNARQHDAERDIPVLMESLRRFGQRKPVVARRDTREVIAGNGTLQAAVRLGWTHIAVSWFHGTDEEAQAYAIADNRTAELSAWNWEELAAQLADLREADAELPGALGWSEEMLAPLLAAEWTAPARDGLPTEVADPPVTVILNAAQHRVVQEAVTRVRANEKDESLTAGRCLELVCADWLSGPYPDGD